VVCEVHCRRFPRPRTGGKDLSGPEG
jgi:hypothetical protein